jgi:glyoxylate/hydroxypyruvate reductase
VRLLLHERALTRVHDELRQFAGLELLVFTESGDVMRDDRSIPLDQVRADVAWYSVDLFASPLREAFAGLLRRAFELKWVQVSAAGLEQAVFAELADREVRLTTSHTHASCIAEFVMAGVLDHYQQGCERRRQQSERIWRPIFFRELMGTDWLIIGFGAIGQSVAQRAKSFGARVTGIRRKMGPMPMADAIAPLSAVHDLLPSADIAVLCIPLCAQTNRLVGTRFLAAMKPGSILVNVGRGGLVDEEALLSALDQGVPEHAVLDVFETEPLPVTSPFWSHPRVALTAHGAGVTANIYPRTDALFLENLRRFIANGPR